MKIIRRLFGLHQWKTTARFQRTCRVCGTIENQYIAWVEPPMDPWWETDYEGDTSAKPCGGRHYKPSRLSL